MKKEFTEYISFLANDQFGNLLSFRRHYIRPGAHFFYSNIPRLKYYLDYILKIISEIEDSSYESLFELIKKEERTDNASIAALALCLGDFGLFSSAKVIQSKILLDEFLDSRIKLVLPEYYAYYHMFKNYSAPLILFENMNAFLSINPSNEFKEIRDEKDVQKYLANDLQEMKRLIRRFLSYLLFVIESTKTKNSNIDHLEHFLNVFLRFLDSQVRNKKEEISQQLLKASKIVDEQKRDEWTLENLEQIFESLEKTVETASDIIEEEKFRTLTAMRAQIESFIDLAHELQAKDIEQFSFEYWNKFIDQTNSMNNLIEIFYEEPTYCKERLAFFLLLNRPCELSYTSSQYQFYSSLSKNFSKVKSPIFAFIQRIILSICLNDLAEGKELMKQVIDRFLTLVKQSDAFGRMIDLEIPIFSGIFEDIIKHFGTSEEGHRIFYQLLQDLTFDYLKNEDFLDCAKLISYIYRFEKFDEQFRERLRESVVNKIYKIIQILADKKKEKPLVMKALDSLKIIEFITRRNSKFIDSTQLVQEVWKDETLLERVQEYLKKKDSFWRKRNHEEESY